MKNWILTALIAVITIVGATNGALAGFLPTDEAPARSYGCGKPDNCYAVAAAKAAKDGIKAIEKLVAAAAKDDSEKAVAAFNELNAAEGICVIKIAQIDALKSARPDKVKAVKAACDPSEGILATVKAKILENNVATRDALTSAQRSRGALKWVLLALICSGLVAWTFWRLIEELLPADSSTDVNAKKITQTTGMLICVITGVMYAITLNRALWGAIGVLGIIDLMILLFILFFLKDKNE